MEMRGQYYFLSNFYPCTITIDVEGQTLTFMNAEAAFQAFKCPERAKEFCKLTPGAAKKFGRKVPIRSDWEDIKLDVMTKVLTTKFSDPVLRQRLKDCTEYIQEDNTWGDYYWGVCNDYGHNHLGMILMSIRDQL